MVQRVFDLRVGKFVDEEEIDQGPLTCGKMAVVGRTARVFTYGGAEDESGDSPTETAVAQSLYRGGLNPATGLGQGLF